MYRNGVRVVYINSCGKQSPSIVVVVVVNILSAGAKTMNEYNNRNVMTKKLIFQESKQTYHWIFFRNVSRLIIGQYGQIFSSFNEYLV